MQPATRRPEVLQPGELAGCWAGPGLACWAGQGAIADTAPAVAPIRRLQPSARRPRFLQAGGWQAAGLGRGWQPAGWAGLGLAGWAG